MQGEHSESAHFVRQRERLGTLYGGPNVGTQEQATVAAAVH